MRPSPPLAVWCFFLATAAGFAGTAPAGADENLNCDAYATKAVAQQQENQALACGYAGGAWSVDYQGHRNWCLLPTVKMANLTHEDNARASALGECRRKDIACGQYAILARRQNQENRERRCGLTGAAWSDDVNGHRAWCMSVGLDPPIAETEARQAALARCHASLTNSDFQNADEKAQQYLNMLRDIMKTMQETRQGTIRNLN